MASNLTTACDATGTLTADASLDCHLSHAQCIDDDLVGLSLRGQGFHGDLSWMASAAIPPHLRSLDLSGNRLSGTIPLTIARLSSLEVLRVDGNQLTGALPSQLSLLANLTVCMLTRDDEWSNYPDNQFDCTLPEGLPRVCGGSGGNESAPPAIECHPPFPPPPPLPPPWWG